MCTGTRIRDVYQGVQGACPRQAVTSAKGTAERQRVPCRRHGSKACLYMKTQGKVMADKFSVNVTKHFTRSCLYTEPRERRLPGGPGGLPPASCDQCRSHGSKACYHSHNIEIDNLIIRIP